MTESEICRECRAAKHKGQQVEILAQLNRLEEGQVIDILLRGGEKVRYFPFEKPVFMKYTWYEQNKRRDLDNVSSFGRKVIQDALVDTGVLKDDGWQYVVGFSDRFEVDKENPRIEVLIKEVEKG